MKWWLLLVGVHAILLHVEAGSVLRAPFYSTAEFPLVFDLSIGTPPQNVAVKIANDAKFEGLFVSANEHSKVFDPTASSTFHQTGLLIWRNETVGLAGTDNFVIGDAALSGLPFTVVTQKCPQFVATVGEVGVGRSGDSSLFFETILEQVEERILVFSFDSADWLTHDTLNETGVVTFGGRQPERCADDWILQPEQPPVDSQWKEWSVAVDEVSFDAYTIDQPGQIFFQLDVLDFVLPNAIFRKLWPLLQVDDWGYSPCDLQLEVVLTIGGREFRVGPADYLDRTEEQSYGCKARFASDSGGSTPRFTFPVALYERTCLLYDYQLPGVGLATRLS